MRPEPQPVPGKRAMECAEITYRQLDYWARTGLIAPDVPATNPESAPRYSFAAVTKLVVLKRLLDLGVSLQDIKQALAGMVMPPGLAIDVATIAEVVRHRMLRFPGPYDDAA